MTKSKFGAGQRVTLVRSDSFAAPAGGYTIVSVLPLDRGPQQYRVKNDRESFERIFDEVRLEAISYD